MTTKSFVAGLDAKLTGVAAEKTKQWWERYLKGDALLRGVKVADTRRAVTALVEEHGFDTGNAAAIFEYAHACFEQPWSEDKLAGVLLLAEHGLHALTIDDIEALAVPLGSWASR